MKRMYSFLLVALFCSWPFIYGKLVEQAKFLDHRSETRVAGVAVDLSTPAAFSNTLMTCDLTAMVGDTATSINLSDDCFDLSDNFVVVLRDTLSGGIVSSFFGTDTVHVCIDDATAAISFNHSFFSLPSTDS